IIPFVYSYRLYKRQKLNSNKVRFSNAEPCTLCSMNYLAHAYLSFNQSEILVGNMISDFVKGKRKFDYPSGIQKGIDLHRAIDQFTDQHSATKEAKEFFRPDYRLYAGAF